MKLKEQSELNLLTALLWGEARGEDFIGKLAVACVVRNRLLDPRWPDTHRDVILQPKQFSCFNKLSRTEHLKKLDVIFFFHGRWDYLPWRECRGAAQLVLGTWVDDITGGANHYHAKGIEPYWATKPCFEHGGHRFYKL